MANVENVRELFQKLRDEQHAALPTDWSGHAHAAIERELQSERASSLRRAGAKVTAAIAAVVEAEARLHEPPGWAAYEAAWAAALHAKWELVVTREAIGLLRHDDVDVVYAMPPRVRRG